MMISAAKLIEPLIAPSSRKNSLVTVLVLEGPPVEAWTAYS